MSQAIAVGSLSDQERTELMDALRGQVRVPRPSLGYRAAEFLVMCAMATLPVIYVLLIALAGLATFWYAAHAHVMLTATHVRGRAAIILFILYVAPIAAGLLLVIFMLRPLVARAAKPMVEIALQRQQEPVLFEFCDRVARLVGAPTARQICISYDVNASAGFRRGWLSMLGNDLTLTIGAPLAANLTVEEFAGVLAHEFGHFTQGAGMRLSYVIRTINIWLARQVYERDTWDVWVSELIHSETHWSIGLIGLLAAMMVGISRIVLRILMLIGHAISSLLLRQMEYDADRYHAGTVGTVTFARTCERITMLAVAESAAHQALVEQRGRCSDICGLIQSLEKQMPAEIRQKIRQNLKETRTGVFDSHPSMRDRALAANRPHQKGFFHDPRPATILFSNFAGVSQMVTLDLQQQAGS